MQVLETLVKACPAGLYKKQEDGTISFDYAGCLEWNLSNSWFR